MKQPQAVRKYDGRTVPFELEKLARSIQTAADATKITPENVPEFESVPTAQTGIEIARATADFMASAGQMAPSTADLREMVIKILIETGYEAVAEIYAEHAQQTASVLWELRVRDGAWREGQAWDRRRLIESLKTSGVAPDHAGTCAREVERKLIALGFRHISKALIHALAAQLLNDRGVETRHYLARRVTASMTTQLPRFNAEVALRHPLPERGAHLRAFWLQAVHSPEIQAVVMGNQLGLWPMPHDNASYCGSEQPACLLDPLASDFALHLSAMLNAELTFPRQGIWIDGPERTQVLIEQLARSKRLMESVKTPDTHKTRRPQMCLHLILKPALIPALETVKTELAYPLCVNVAGALLREGLNSLERATPKLAHLISLAAQAHREREEYLGYSPVRGRWLPIFPVGVWNAAAWMSGLGLDQTTPEPKVRVKAAALATALYGAVAVLRQETGMRLILISPGPTPLALPLWERDCGWLARDGQRLDPTIGYSCGLDLTIGSELNDLSERISFLKHVAERFDLPPVLEIDVPLTGEIDAAQWRDLLGTLTQSGLPMVRLNSRGSARGLKLLLKVLKCQLEGLPLFEQQS